MTELSRFATKGGANFTVSAQHAERFKALLDDLEAAGYAVKGDQSGGYNYRNIAGTNTLSKHAHGNAVDINWTDNPRGKAGAIPADLARQLAAKHGMTWGGDWSNPDPMHFEVAGGTAVASRAPYNPNAPASGQSAETLPAHQAASVSAPTGEFGDLADTIAQALGSSDGNSAFGSLAAPATEPADDGLMRLPAMPRRKIDLGKLRAVLASRGSLGVGRA